MFEKILVISILWLVGVFFGFILRGAFFSASEAELKVRKKLKEVEIEFFTYQKKINDQMLKTSEVLSQIQKGCQIAQDQVSLVTQEINARKISQIGNLGEMGELVEPPKDYSSHS
jgi:uncharacterized membrane-anchored protein YhcB (DUF1043 family)